MLDIKHKNIGATVSMLNLVYGAFKTDKLDGPLAELFMEERKDCDYLRKPLLIGYKCGYFALYEPGEDKAVPCCIGECPLGRLVDEELKGMSMGNIQDKMDATFIGPCVHCGCDVTSDNMAHVDDDVQMCEPCFNEKEVGSS